MLKNTPPVHTTVEPHILTAGSLHPIPTSPQFTPMQDPQYWFLEKRHYQLLRDQQQTMLTKLDAILDCQKEQKEDRLHSETRSAVAVLQKDMLEMEDYMSTVTNNLQDVMEKIKKMETTLKLNVDKITQMWTFLNANAEIPVGLSEG